jgi:hypothetical protein
MARGRSADVKGPQDRKLMAADVGDDVVRTELVHHEFHRRDDRALGTTGTEARGSCWHRMSQRPHLRRAHTDLVMDRIKQII